MYTIPRVLTWNNVQQLILAEASHVADLGNKLKLLQKCSSTLVGKLI